MDFTGIGRWRFVDHPATSFPGRLEVEDDRARLTVSADDLVPVLGESVLALYGEDAALDWPLLTGILDEGPRDGRHVTLFGLQTQRRGLGQLTAQADLATFGAGAPTEDRFDEIRMTFDWLRAWIQPPALTPGFDWSQTGRIEIELGEQVMSAATLPNATAELVSQTRYRAAPYEVSARRLVQVRARLTGPATADALIEEWVRLFQDFFIIAMGKPVQVESVWLRPARADDSKRAGSYGLVRAVYARQQKPVVENPSETSFISYGSPAFLQGPEFVTRFSAIVPAWYEVHARYSEAVARLTAPARAKAGLYLDSEYALIAQALESAQSVAHQSKDLPTEQHRERVDRVIGALESSAVGLPTEDLDWARRVLSGTNHRSFAQRVEDMIGEAGQLGELIVRRIPDFAARVERARHAVSHGRRVTSRGVNRQSTSVERYFIKELVVCLLRASLLTLCGVADAVDRAAANDHTEHALHQLERLASSPAAGA